MHYNDKFYPTEFKKLLQLILKQLKNNEILGLPDNLFFKPMTVDFFKTQYINQPLDSPIGVAAGPQTQLAQNIIMAWIAGARFIELKTVQTLDQIEVSKPCIDMQDEGYNCEWSQELRIQKAFDEYLNAWIILHILQHELGFENFGTIFNMSVGYDFKGIMQPNIQWFLDKMTNAETEIAQKCLEIADIYPQISKINIPSQITDNITLSTMHGCPPAEVEQIANYLINDRKFNTIIKLNPTLLGKDKVQNIFNFCGYKTQVPDIAFEHDLKYNDAIGIINRLTDLAAQNNVFFGIKLSNTLESINNKNVFDKNNEMMYMSGAPLHLIAINLAKKLQNEFNGNLNISFSGGIDTFNIAESIACGLKPITICSDLLKPGGYGRLHQYYDVLRSQNQSSKTIEQLIINVSKTDNDVKNCTLNNLNHYADAVLQNNYYKKTGFDYKSIKTNRNLDKFDCIVAPCQTTCPTNQNVPQYMYLTQNNRLNEAFDTITTDNPFPTITGYVCDHDCQEKCTRINYDKALNIRDIKRFIADNVQKTFIQNEEHKNHKIAIIGAGPAGLSCAYYLLQNGFSVEIFEKNNNAGGMTANAIPKFRLPETKVEIDINRIIEMGAKINFNYNIDSNNFNEINSDFNFIFIGVGAQAALSVGIEGSDAEGVWNPLMFFYQTRKTQNLNIGKRVAIIGAGNTAMDAARIAKRLVPADGEVVILYRRTIEQMPANYEEIADTLKDGVEIVELVEPVEFIQKKGKLCSIKLIRTKLEQKQGERRLIPVKIEGSDFEMPFDSVIVATGQQKDFDFFADNFYKNYAIPQTKIPNIFIGGDAVRGAASAIKAIADGKKAAFEIIKQIEPNFELQNQKLAKKISYAELKIKKATRIFPQVIAESTKASPNNFELISQTYSSEQAKYEADRCLLCDELCDVCVSVCPNLANQTYNIDPFTLHLPIIDFEDNNIKIVDNEIFTVKQSHQTYNIADWCNECGNCDTFCPSSGKPYLDKPKVHLSDQSFNDSPFGYKFEEQKIMYKDNNQLFVLSVFDDKIICKNDSFTAEFDKNWQITNFSGKQNVQNISFRKFAEMFTMRPIAKNLIV